MKKLKALLLSYFLLTIGLSYSQEIFFFDEHGNELANKLVIVETNSLDTIISSKKGSLEINNIDRLKSVEINVKDEVFVKFSKKEIIAADYNVMVIINAYSLPAFEAKTERKSHVPFGLQNIFHEIIQEQDILNSSASTGAELLLLSSGVTIQKSQLDRKSVV